MTRLMGLCMWGMTVLLPTWFLCSRLVLSKPPPNDDVSITVRHVQPSIEKAVQYAECLWHRAVSEQRCSSRTPASNLKRGRRHASTHAPARPLGRLSASSTSTSAFVVIPTWRRNRSVNPPRSFSLTLYLPRTNNKRSEQHKTAAKPLLWL